MSLFGDKKEKKMDALVESLKNESKDVTRILLVKGASFMASHILRFIIQQRKAGLSCADNLAGVVRMCLLVEAGKLEPTMEKTK